MNFVSYSRGTLQRSQIMSVSEGYKCKFVDSVFEDLYCKKCTLVARRLTIATCCGESFCQTCIADTQEQGQPCPVCGENEFTTFEFIKNQKRISNLKVYCSMKERGCVWSGTLDQLDTHLDPHLDNCQYVDTKCPLNCLQAIPKNKVEQHVAQECSERPHICQHCGFKGTYEKVIDIHLPECLYVPLQCPNMCGVSCEREVMEDHMKICRLQEVDCEFNHVGCDSRFVREDQDEHTRLNSHKHLILTATLTVESKKQLVEVLLEQDRMHKEKENNLMKKIEEQKKKLVEQETKLMELETKLEGQEKKLVDQEKKLVEQNKNLVEQDKKVWEQEKLLTRQEKNLSEKQIKLGEHEKNLREQENKLGEQDNELGKLMKKLGEQKKTLGEQEEKLGEQGKEVGKQGRELGEQRKEINEVTQSLHEVITKVNYLASLTSYNWKAAIKEFSIESQKPLNHLSPWKSSAMYTHAFGYKFCVGVSFSDKSFLGKIISVDFFSMPGKFDDQLKWPVNAKITMEVINQENRRNDETVETIVWNRPATPCNYIKSLRKLTDVGLKGFIVNDTVYFHVSNIELL